MPQGYISGHVILLLLLSAYLFISVCLKHCVLTRRQRTKLYTDTHTQHSFLFGKKEGRAQKRNASTVLLLYLSELHAGRSRSFYLPSPPAPPFQHTQGLLVFSASCISILFPMSIQTHLYANTHTYFLNYVLIMLYTLVSKLKVLSFVERSGERDSSLCLQYASTSVFLSPFWCFFFIGHLLAVLHGMQDRSSWTRDWTHAPALTVQHLNHWVIREVPHVFLLSLCIWW